MRCADVCMEEKAGVAAEAAGREDAETVFLGIAIYKEGNGHMS